MADKSSVNCITFIDEAALMCGTDAGSVYIYDLRNNRYGISLLWSKLELAVAFLMLVLNQ